jgi:hypothetical protein
MKINIKELKLQNLLLTKRMIICQAENDIVMHNRWCCNWAQAMEEIDIDISNFIKEIESEVK